MLPRRCWVSRADSQLDAARAIAGALLRVPVDVEPAPGSGRNSRVYRVYCRQQSFALKHYPGQDRLQTEVGALELLKQHGISAVPRVVASDAMRGYALFDWIEGEGVTTPTAADIDTVQRLERKLAAAVPGSFGISHVKAVRDAQVRSFSSENRWPSFSFLVRR